MGFSIWDDTNTCLSWDETLEWFDLLGVTPVPVLYDGLFDEQALCKLWDSATWASSEGYVVRLAEPLGYGDFQRKVAKFVRKGHVQAAKHWMHGQRIEKNQLAT